MSRLTNANEPINVLFGKYSQHNNAWQNGRHYERIPIYVESSKGACMPLLLKTAKCFSLGAKQNTNKETGEAYGWVLQICLLEEDVGDKVEQSVFLQALKDVIEQVKTKVRAADMQDSFNYVIPEEEIVKVGGCLWKGEKDYPILYAKINDNKGRAGMYNSRIYKVDDIYDPTLRKPVKKEEITECCYVQAVICVDSIIVYENRAHLKIQVYEANIQDLRFNSFLEKRCPSFEEKE